MAIPTTNNFVFAILMIFTQTIIAVMNGVFIRPGDQNSSSMLILPAQSLF
jgi:hypothetical protein